MKLLVFWSIFGLVVFGVLLTLFQNRRQQQRQAAEHDALPMPLPLGERHAAAVPKPEAPSAAPSAGSPSPAPFDPTSTRLYARQDHVSAPIDDLARAGAARPLHGTPKLICLGGRLKGHQFPISGIGLSIGRADDNDVVIVDGRVSAHHAWIGVVNGKAVLRDYQSLNGTFLNADMDTPVSEVALVEGDTIFFGGHGGDQYRFVLA